MTSEIIKNNNNNKTRIKRQRYRTTYDLIYDMLNVLIQQYRGVTKTKLIENTFTTYKIGSQLIDNLLNNNLIIYCNKDCPLTHHRNNYNQQMKDLGYLKIDKKGMDFIKHYNIIQGLLGNSSNK